MNLGVAEAIARGADTFLLLNPDASLDRDAVAALTAYRRSSPMSLISPTVLRPDGSTWFRGAVLEVRRGRTRSGEPAPGSADLAWLSGACLMTSRQLWDRLGGFDEDYFLYWEDVDLSVRASRAGAELVVLTDVTAVHDEGGTQDRPGDSEEHSDTYYYFNIRNRLLFAAKNLDPRDRRRWLLTSIGESYQILLRGGGRRKFLRPWHPLRLGARGLWDGWRMSRAVDR
jgi:GT2 family glycosyltransferase